MAEYSYINIGVHRCHFLRVKGRVLGLVMVWVLLLIFFCFLLTGVMSVA